jgi:hypothetical protein
MIRLPVKKEGAYIASKCHSITTAVSANECPHPAIANGVEVISRFITPYATIALKIATRNLG